MLDAKFGMKAVTNFGEYGRVLGRRIRVQSDMRAEGDMSRADIPDVQVVHAGNPLDLKDDLSHLLDGYALRNTFDEDMERPAGDAVGAEEDQRGDEQTGERVYPQPAGKRNDDGGQDYP